MIVVSASRIDDGGWRISWAQDAAGITGGHGVGRHIAGDHAAGADDRPRADRDAGHDKHPREEERFLTDPDRGRLQPQVRIVEVVRARAQIRFLGDGGARADLDLAEAVGVGAITQRGAVVQREFPGTLDARTRMDLRPPVQPAPKTRSTKSRQALSGFGVQPQSSGQAKCQSSKPTRSRVDHGESVALRWCVKVWSGAAISESWKQRS